MIEMIERNSPGAERLISEQFSKLGHVGIVGAYDVALAPRVAEEMLPKWGRLRRTPDGNQQAVRCAGSFSSLSVGCPHLTEMLLGVDMSSALLGAPSLLSAHEGVESRIGLIDMDGRKNGTWHQDGPEVKDVVSVTNLYGPSRLQIVGADHELVADYDIEPGTVVFMDSLRKLTHRGAVAPQANPDGTTTYLPRLGLLAGFSARSIKMKPISAR